MGDKKQGHLQTWKIRADEYFETPSLEHYVKIRRLGVGADVISFPRDRRLPHDVLVAAGLDPGLVADALDRDDERAIDALALRLCELLVERKRLESEGGTHLQRRGKAISDALVNYLALQMLAAIARRSYDIPPSLFALMAHQLGGTAPPGAQQHENEQRRKEALIRGVLVAHRGQRPTLRRVASIMGVEPSTISRLFQGLNFEREVEKLRETKFTCKGTRRRPPAR
jgi:hypothetical protein